MILYLALLPLFNIVYAKRIKSLINAKKEHDYDTVKSDYIKLFLMLLVTIFIVVMIEFIKQN